MGRQRRPAGPEGRRPEVVAEPDGRETDEGEEHPLLALALITLCMLLAAAGDSIQAAL